MWEIAIRDLDNSQDLAASILAMGNYSRNRISWLTDNKKNWDTFYLLLWEVLNHKTLRPNNQSKLLGKSLTQMDAAPCEGPYCYRSDYDDSGENWQGGGIYAGGGWATDYRWFKKERQQNFGQWCTGNYNGLDYMLLYNLYHIMTKEESPSYVNYCDKKLAGIVNSPIKFVGFNSITSTQTINNTEPTVVYKAGDYINLKPGFHVENGSNFHAFIENINCSGTDYPNNIFTPSYDELISIPQDSYIVKIADDSASSVLNFTLPCPNDTIKFNGLFGDNNEDNYLYYWDFGNGQTSTLENPEIFYDTPGTYNMTVIYTDTSNISDTFKIDIIVPDCKLYGTCVLTCNYNYSQGDYFPVTFEGDSVLIMHNNIPVSSVSPAILQYNGSYNFNLSQILQLNPTALYQLAIRVPDHYHGIMDSYMHYLTDEATINQLILNSRPSKSRF